MRLAAPVGMTRRTEFWTGEPCEVLEFLLLDPEKQPALLRQLAVPRPGITLYDCDVAPALTYCHARGIFPLAKVTASFADAPISKFEIQNSKLVGPRSFARRESPTCRRFKC